MIVSLEKAFCLSPNTIASAAATMAALTAQAMASARCIPQMIKCAPVAAARTAAESTRNIRPTMAAVGKARASRNAARTSVI